MDLIGQREDHVTPEGVDLGVNLDLWSLTGVLKRRMLASGIIRAYLHITYSCQPPFPDLLLRTLCGLWECSLPNLHCGAVRTMGWVCWLRGITLLINEDNRDTVYPLKQARAWG